MCMPPSSGLHIKYLYLFLWSLNEICFQRIALAKVSINTRAAISIYNAVAVHPQKSQIRDGTMTSTSCAPTVYFPNLETHFVCSCQAENMQHEWMERRVQVGGWFKWGSAERVTGNDGKSVLDFGLRTVILSSHTLLLRVNQLLGLDFLYTGKLNTWRNCAIKME